MATTIKIDHVAIMVSDLEKLQLSHLCECLGGNSAPRVTLEFSLGNMRVIDAVHESLRTRMPVVLPPAN